MGTWIDTQGEYFDTVRLSRYLFQDGGCYLLLGTEEDHFHFPTITIHKMAKMPFTDPRYSMDKEKSLKAGRTLYDYVSMTHTKPYPQEHEIGLPRLKMK